MKRIKFCLALTFVLTCCAIPEVDSTSPSFALELTAPAADEIAGLGLTVPVTGRAYVVLTRDGEREPRLQTGLRGVTFWGMEVSGLAGGEEVVLEPGGNGVLGYPLESLKSAGSRMMRRVAPR